MPKSRHYYKLPGEDELPFSTCLVYVITVLVLTSTALFVLWKAWA